MFVKEKRLICFSSLNIFLSTELKQKCKKKCNTVRNLLCVMVSITNGNSNCNYFLVDYNC